MQSAVSVSSRPQSVRQGGGISPLRRSVLEQLREPGSAASVAAQLGVSRQRVAYHVRELEQSGLVQLVEERARRGCVERIVKVTAGVTVAGPLVPARSPAAQQDRFAADRLTALSSRTVSELAHLSERAAASNRRLVTFAIESDVGFERPADIEQFTNRLAEAVTRLVAEFDTGLRQHRFRLVVGGYPQPSDATVPSTPGEGT